MSKKVSVVNLSKSMFLLMLLSLMGCYTTVHNVKATDDLGGKKVLAGRILCYDNDAPSKDSSRKFVMFFNKEGDTKAEALEPDDDGYVYVPVTAGKYNFGSVKVVNLITGTFNFTLPTFPSVTVNDNDSAVNFGTFHVKFYQSGGSKTGASLVGIGRAQIKVEHMPDYDVTRSAIVAKIGAGMPLKDGKVSFFNRAQ
jgi:hypothetical protein